MHLGGKLLHASIFNDSDLNEEFLNPGTMILPF